MSSTDISSSSSVLSIIACISFFTFGMYFLNNKKYIIALILFIAFTNYSGILTNVLKFDVSQDTTEQLPRYLDWIVTTPLLLLLLMTKMNIKDPSYIAFIMGLDVLMIYMGILAGKEDDYTLKMILYWISNFFFLTIFVLLWKRNPPKFEFFYLFFFWSIYPIVWGLYEFLVIDSNAYGSIIPVLDMGAKIGFGFLI